VAVEVVVAVGVGVFVGTGVEVGVGVGVGVTTDAENVNQSMFTGPVKTRYKFLIPVVLFIPQVI